MIDVTVRVIRTKYRANKVMDGFIIHLYIVIYPEYTDLSLRHESKLQIPFYWKGPPFKTLNKNEMKLQKNMSLVEPGGGSYYSTL